MGRKRRGRNINGILLLNKGLGGSSNHDLQRVKRIFQAAKAGHTGALDPLATGMLPICLGEATKFSQFLLDADKTYEVTAKLGVRTTTSDADGEVVETKTVNVGEAEFTDVCATFRGKSKQIASMFSALKYQGKPLYHYARQGIEVPREPRDINIFSLEILRFDKDEADLRVHCSKGTYIRSLVDDIGQKLGCGAFVSRLHRTQVTDYPAENMLSMQALEEVADKSAEGDFSQLDQLLLPMDTAVKSLPCVTLSEPATNAFQHGQAVEHSLTHPQDELVRVYQENTNLFLGVGQIDVEAKVAPKRLVVYPT